VGTQAGNDAQATVEAVVNEAAFRPLFGLAGGEPLVNVLEVNLELSRRLGR
jgi:K+-transporting ATPase c subunit